MKYDPGKHHRRSIRLKHHDYTKSAAYFVTIVTNNRAAFFGDITNTDMNLNGFGVIVEKLWKGLPDRFPTVSLDAFILMPNHLHGIIIIGKNREKDNSGAMNRAPTLGNIIRGFKGSSTRKLRQAGTADFAWQRNYHEHVIRNENSLDRIRRYILDNPEQWMIDRENPSATVFEPEDVWRR
jgi:putative transposase